MTTTKDTSAEVRRWVIAIFMVLTICALAPTRGAGASPDMRLWSFGDCQRKFPSADTEEYKECMRVVGSPEAKDLRAQRICEDSYANDHKGIDRCLSAHRLTKERPGGVASDASGVAGSALSPEMTLQVQAIASAAVEQRTTEVKESVSAETATPRAGSSLTSLVLVGALGILLLGIGGAVVLRRQV